MRRGFLITLEGPEGSGKSTHGRRLSRWLKAQGYKVLFTREPGGTRLGQRLRKILLDKRSGELPPVVELCLYEASRSILIRQVIQPALKAGAIVILDRFQDSTWVYQGWAGGVDLKLIQSFGKAATGNLMPDVTILLDLPVREGLYRVRHPNRMEAKPVAFHEKVRSGYRVLARRHPGRIHLISANRPVNLVQEEIRKVVRRVLR